MSGAPHDTAPPAVPAGFDDGAEGSSVPTSTPASDSGKSGFAQPQSSAERELLRRVAVGDPQAFWELWTEHRNWLFEICYTYMGCRREDAEDALGDVMERARETLPREALRIRNLAPWLRRVAVHVCIDRYRRDKSHHQILCAARAIAPLQLSEVQSIECDNPASELMAYETRDIVTRAVEGLPGRLRTAASLFFLEEAPYPVIAAVLGISEQNSRKRIQEARSILKKLLDAEFPERRQSGSVGTAESRPRATARRRLAEAVNRGPRVSAQHALATQINESPGVIAGRKRLDAMFGGAGKTADGGERPD